MIMKTRFTLNTLLPALALMLFLATPQRLLALAGELDRPSIALPDSIDPAWREAVGNVLDDPSAGFRHGRFVNGSTTLGYQGDAAALSRFLAGLVRCADARIQITFVRELDVNWRLTHHGWGDARLFSVQVNLGSETLRLEALTLPVIKGNAEVDR